MNKKKLVALAAVVSMIAILSFSTLAWFTDSDSVTNNFQVAGGDDADKIFSVDVMEAVDGNDDGRYDWDGSTGDKTIGLESDASNNGTFTYENVMPGDMLFKRPSTKNTGSYDQYLRMKVTFHNAAELIDILDDYGLTPVDMLLCVDGSIYSNAIHTNPKTPLTTDPDWTFGGSTGVQADNTITYSFYYNSVLEVGKSATLFSWVNIPYQLTQAQMAQITNGLLKMVVTGEAVQTENLGADVDTAVEAFAVVEQTQPFN